MIISITNSPTYIYLQGISPKGTPASTGYRMKLVSRYSNNGILNDVVVHSASKYFPLTKIDDYDTWYSYQLTWTNTDLESFDVEGYYTAVFEHFTAGVWVENERRLVKLINEWEDNLFDEYLSDNETNIQIINYTDNV